MSDLRRPQENVTSSMTLLADQRRRHALRSLREYENPMALADLADEVAVLEHDAPITEISAETVKRIYLSLYHTHVPKLAAEGIVDYDQERDLVALSDRAERLGALQDALAEVDSG